MSEVEELLQRASAIMRDIWEEALRRLEAGIEIALLGRGARPQAEIAIEELIVKLVELRDQLR